MLAEPKWVGFLKIRSKSSGQWTTPTTANRQWKSTFNYVAPVEVTMLSESNFALVELKPGTFNINVVDDSTFQGMSVLTYVARCLSATSSSYSFMNFPTDNSYTFHPTPFIGVYCAGFATQPEGRTPVQVGWYTYNTNSYSSLFTFTPPALNEPLRLHATRHFTTVNGALVSSVPEPLPYGSTPVEWDFEWDLRPEETDVDLVLSAEDHDTWLPKATIPGSGPVSLTGEPSQIAPGSTIVLKAEVIPRDPASSTAMKQMTFNLVSSELPGIAMNWQTSQLAEPPLFEANPADLRFDSDKNTSRGLEYVSETTVQTPESTALMEATAEVSSYDFGGFGEAFVLGLSTNDRFVISRLKDPSVPPGSLPAIIDGRLLLPKRASDSIIADSWKQSMGTTLKSDNDDTESLPSPLGTGGTGHHGDGLSQFEEYRGFVLKGAHFRSDPTEVDYFLRNETGAAFVPGISLFSSLTHIKVHDVGPYDFPSVSRIINANHSGGVHNNLQRAVIIKSEFNKYSKSTAHGIVGTPKDVLYIGIATTTPPADLKFVVAHELAHSANVPHHGEGGIIEAKWTLDNSTGTVTEYPDSPAGMSCGRINAIRGTPDPLTDEQYVFIGGRCQESNKSSVFSGAHDCIMRTPANAHIPMEGGHRHERIVITESYGNTLCTSSDGTGFNSPPNSRYGSAMNGRGECAQKVCVNDGHVHPTPTAIGLCTPYREVASTVTCPPPTP
ncbi:hypothetical protein JY651_29425 [Pyxidicoccus parkwayensis]|uniref:Uncharacterized protein n=1 Tax=Pyxidicoccus parkwayensis TaxID=2813578 RepID=A0ABX7NM54_9BACT|nr:hypothetical protein [Pyxidicoccus parkwaysis]QSQ19434.1 hypothetical protein JY651_29425 [Pyxidicoccus parkwaysis]